MSVISFHRPARIQPPALPSEKIVLSAPPQLQRGGGAGSMAMLLMPVLSSVSMAAYMMIYHNTVLIIVGISFVVLSVGATIGWRWQMRNASARDKFNQRERYFIYLADTRRAAREVAKAQRELAIWQHPSPARLSSIASTRRRVWERRVGDRDFLQVRLGMGRGPLATPIQLGVRSDPTVEYDRDALRTARRLVAGLTTVGSQPATVRLAEAGVVSVLGPGPTTCAVTSALLCQVGVLHAPDDVTIAVHTAGYEQLDWAKWLPHCRDPEAIGPNVGVPMVALGLNGLDDFLQRELARATQDRDRRRTLLGADRTAGPRRRLVVVFAGYDPSTEWARSTVVTGLIQAAGPELGITVLCLADDEAAEPSRVDVRVKVDEDGALAVEGPSVELFAAVEDAIADQPPAALCSAIARALTPLRLSADRDEALANAISLPQLLGWQDVGELDPRTAWKAPDDEDVLRIPLGMRDSGEALVLDLKESARAGMGPHGLVVGATGSGKSELLRTLVTGLVATHSPDLLSLVLVDFKGGATFAGVTELPHVAGLITNLADDLALLERVRAALHGEQQRRQRILRNAGNVDSLLDYQLRYAAGHTDVDGKKLEPLPYLLIIVDEFGELLSQRPDFIDLFVQIGRVGRSLGIHLLLATQRLEEGRLRGLESHLSYRICLRTFSAAESRAVIGTTDAYRLPSIPGSAYLKVDESIYERFRVAHASAPYGSPSEVAAEPVREPAKLALFSLRSLGDIVPDTTETSADRATPVSLGPTQMQVAVAQLCRFGQPVHQVWVPPLPEAFSLSSLLGSVAINPVRGLQSSDWSHRDLKVPLGVIDLPMEQRQIPLAADFVKAHGNLAVVGAPQSGKSTLLRSLMLGAALTHTPEEMQFYCIDYGGGTLTPLAKLPHVGAVAGRHDQRRVARILAEASQLVSERERLFRELGISAVADFRRLHRAGKLAEGTRTADVFIVLDNWGNIRTELPGADEAVVDLAARGLGAGVHVLLTANRWGEVRVNLKDAINGRLELRLNDPAESEVDRRLARGLSPGVPGRALVPPGVLCQIALPRLDGRDTLDGVSDAQDEAVDKLAACWTGPAAPAVRVLPESVTVAELADDEPGDLAGGPVVPGVPVGIAEEDLRPVRLDLTTNGPHLLVIGDSGSGKSTLLRTWMRGLAARTSPWESRFLIVDYRRGLFDVVPDPYVGAYAGDADAAQQYLGMLGEKLRDRMPPQGISTKELRDRSWWSGPELYVVVDDYDLVGGGPQSPLAPLVNYLTQAPEIGLHVVIARRSAGMSRTSMGDLVVTRLRDLGVGGLLLSGDPREGPLLDGHRAAVYPPGRGLLVRRGCPPALVQVASSDPAD